MERTHQGLSTSEVWKSYCPWCRYSEVKCQLQIWPWNLEHSKSRSQTKIMMERNHQGLSTSEALKRMKLNANNRFDLETWNLQGQGHRQRSQWVELIKVYLNVKFEIGIVNCHSTMNLNAKSDLTLKFGTFKVKVTKVTMGRTHQGLSTCEVWKRYCQWSFCNELKRKS